ncbi:alpha/beta fold hydrolase [Streptomyces sp. CA-243310]|uniref:alpha/beta fold hydrolase n=1 Tax=Streptomyces sp. CA-243310 TaxID=3240056 RepID=UPI003D8E62B9
MPSDRRGRASGAAASRRPPVVVSTLLGLTVSALVAAGPAVSPGGGLAAGAGGDVRLECRGAGSPTVVLVSGAGGASDEWTHLSRPAGTTPEPSPSAVLPTVASFTRVCAYDRPGTTRFDGSPGRSTTVPQPTTAAEGVADLRTALSAAGERPPYVLVGASWGGMIAALFARTEPSRTVGLVTVDGASPFLRAALTPAQWSAWMDKIRATDTGKGLEVPDYPASLRELADAPALPRGLPAVVLTSDHPWDLRLGVGGSTWPAWLAAQDRLARDLHARHVTHTDSGHGIAVEQPGLVTDAVREVVDQVRHTGTPAPGRGSDRPSPRTGRAPGAD